MGQLRIPDFAFFTDHVEKVYHKVLPNVSGVQADYIPQLAKVIFFLVFHTALHPNRKTSSLKLPR